MLEKNKNAGQELVLDVLQSHPLFNLAFNGVPDDERHLHLLKLQLQ